MKILLIGNYPPDRQESMLRYASVLRDGLAGTGHEVRVAAPRARLDHAARGASGVWKWAGYVDKLVLAPGEIRRAARWADVVHVCDHSNATYVPRHRQRPWIVTCHDLLALRGALGEETDCPASPTGRALQRMILAGLRRADAYVADSGATLDDVARVVARPGVPAEVIPPPLNYPFRRLPSGECDARLAGCASLGTEPYLLMVGSNLRRKNRALGVRLLARLRDRWRGRLVFAGEAPDEALWREIDALGVADRVVALTRPSGELLEALYNRAFALLFPSRFEGYGWPLIEAQACGCPVIASTAPPHPEVTGGAALLCRLDAEAEFDDAVLALASDRALRDSLVTRGLANAARFDVESFAARVSALYESVA